MNTILLATLIITALIVALSLLVQQVRRLLLPSHLVSIMVNQSRTVPAQAGRKLLEALDAENIHLPSACAGVGTCGLCKVKVKSGGGSLLPTERAKLSNTECEAGMRLACQLSVRNDLEITVPDDVFSAQQWTCTVISSKYLSPLIKELVLELPAGSTLNFTAGSYVQVTTPPFVCDFKNIQVDEAYRQQWADMNLAALSVTSDVPVTRAYSIANQNENRKQVVLLIRLALPPGHSDLPPGKVSSRLFSLNVSDQIAVSGPFGDFAVQNQGRPIVLIGGGVGMAPLRAIIHQQLRENTGQDISFYYGARSLTDLFYKEEFDQLVQEHTNFEWTVALSEPATSDQWLGETGFIHEVVQHQFIESNPIAEECDYYLCGPPLMLKAVINMLQKNGIDETRIYSDNFET